jgi:hypothetical protein
MPKGSKPNDWQELTQLTHGAPIVVERVRLAEKDIGIEGSFELPQLAAGLGRSDLYYCFCPEPRFD